MKNRKKSTNYKGVSLLIIIGKVYSIIIIKLVTKTKNQLNNEHCVFQKSRECVDQIFALRTTLWKPGEEKTYLLLLWI